MNYFKALQIYFWTKIYKMKFKIDKYLHLYAFNCLKKYWPSAFYLIIHWQNLSSCRSQSLLKCINSFKIGQNLHYSWSNYAFISPEHLIGRPHLYLSNFHFSLLTLFFLNFLVHLLFLIIFIFIEITYFWDFLKLIYFKMKHMELMQWVKSQPHLKA